MSKKKGEKVKKQYPVLNSRPDRKITLIMGIILIMAGILGSFIGSDEDTWSVSEEGTLSYKMDKTDYETSDLTSAGDHADTILRSVNFKSRSEQIAGIIRIPVAENEVNGLVVLPGAGISKEQQNAIPELLANMGYASITIDQRGLGAIDPQSDLDLFKNGNEPVQYMMIHDALMAADILRAQDGISDDIAMLGLSNGGRSAIISAAIDPDIKGVVAISTAGYDIDTIGKDKFSDESEYLFYNSIDPDNYLDMLQGRRIAMFHSTNDSIISHETAKLTFDKASEPKALHSIEASTHGYDPMINEMLEEELDLIFE